MSGASHWKSAEDPRTGRTYYYHEITRETQWRKPTELASDEEKRAMEEKERKQKDFFASMEANILNSLSQGLVPGKPLPREIARRKSSRRQAERPELVRTISTMDNLVLKDLIQRQPSFRSVSRNSSLDAAEFASPTSKPSKQITSSDFESFVSIMSEHEPLHPLQESTPANDNDNDNDDSSLPELFSYLPDENELDMNDSMHTNGEATTVRTDGGEFNESNSAFGLTWEETQAFRKLASITKEMIDMEKEDEKGNMSTKPNDSSPSQTQNLISKDTKAIRGLPREIELDDEDEDESEREFQNTSNAFQKAKDIGGRELDFDESDEDESESGLAPTPMKPKGKDVGQEKDKPAVSEDVEQRPDVKRRNTCGTMYVGTTMSAPDKDANIKCVCGVLRTHILSSEGLPYDIGADEFRVFNDREADQSGRKSKSRKRESRPPTPSLEDVTRFYRDIFYKAQMESDCIIMSLIYVERLIKKTGGKLRPRSENWRSLLFSCMILSSKVWDDLSMWNVDFSQSCPPGVTFSLQRINELELAVLHALSFQVKVPASEYAKYYFLLRSMLIKSGLGGDKMIALDPLDVMAARQLQEVSSQFENLKLSQPGGSAKRSQSVNITSLEKTTGTKLGLEQVVKM